MSDEKPIPKVNLRSTKKEILNAFNAVKSQLKEKSQGQLNPEEIKEKRKKESSVNAAEQISKEVATDKLEKFKEDVTNQLTDLSWKLKEETEKYNRIKEAITAKEQELKELFEIESNGFTLAALVESQHLKQEEFEKEMQQKRDEWEKEKIAIEESIKEQRAWEEKKWKREKEEYLYQLAREEELQKNKLKDELESQKRNIDKIKEEFEKEQSQKTEELQNREKEIAEREKSMDELQSSVDNFAIKLEKEIQASVKETNERLGKEHKMNESLLKKEHEGEKNVLQTKITSMEKQISEQQNQIRELSDQLNRAYEKVQDIAIHAVSARENIVRGERYESRTQSQEIPVKEKESKSQE